MSTKFIFVTGGVVSSLGKGITAASLGRLLKCRGLRVSIQKFDPYINVDPGTMSPYQHGEVFVTDDYPGMGIYGFGTMSMPPTLQSATFKLKNGLHITTYGEYDADGNKVRNPSALPWERNNFNGAFEMKSENGNFGIRIEVQRGRNNPF